MTDKPATYFDRAMADADQERLTGGRFKNELTARVVGVPTYPPQPVGSPWHNDPVPREPPLGIAIDDMGDGG
jgi:hypothetical protein